MSHTKRPARPGEPTPPTLAPTQAIPVLEDQMQHAIEA